MELVQLHIVKLFCDEMDEKTYVLVLADSENNKRLPIIIGESEAHSIAMEFEHIKTPRPLTHDLIKNIGDKLGFFVKDVCIHDYNNGFYVAQITLIQNDVVVEVDSRTSDAIALALRFHSPIYATSDLWENAATELEIQEPSQPLTDDELRREELRIDYAFDSVPELQAKLSKAIQIEDYETASIIRDELNSRNL